MTIRRPLFTCLASLVAVLAPSVCRAQIPPYTIQTVIGTGTSGYTTDGTISSSSQLASPFGIAVDSSGNLFIADQVNNRIRKVSSATLSTVAGNGTAGFAGDGGSATDAKTQVNYPEGVAVDSSGNVYIADTLNCVVRKVSGGNISTVVGNGGYCDYAGNNVAGTGADINTPAAVALDSAGNLYIADTKNNLVRKFGTDGNITDFAGNLGADFTGDNVLATQTSLNNPEGVAVDSAGNVYIADTGNHRIRKVGTNGIITTVAGNGAGKFAGDGGLAINASLNHPKGVAVDAAGNIYIADTFNNRIRVVSGGVIFTIAGRTLAGFSGDGGLAADAQLHGPVSFAFGSGGSIYFSDNQNHAIRLLTPVAGSQVPAVSSGGVITAADFGGLTSISPGTWIEIYGTNLASTTREWTNGDFVGITAPTSLSGTKVTIGGLAAPVSYVSAGQVNVQVPSGVAAGEQPLVVFNGTAASPAVNVTVVASQPSLLAKSSFSVGGKQYAVAVFPDGTFVGPAGAFPGVTSRPAKPGETILLFGIGFGPEASGTTSGQKADAAQNNTLTSLAQVMFGSAAATVSYQGLAPGYVGLYQFNVVVPEIPAGDAVPLTYSLGGVAGTQTLYTAVGN